MFALKHAVLSAYHEKIATFNYISMTEEYFIRFCISRTVTK